MLHFKGKEKWSRTLLTSNDKLIPRFHNILEEIDQIL